jgi:Flp pilus assembly protein TadD
MLMHPTLSRIAVTLAALLGLIPFAVAACVAPQSLQAKLKSHPDANTYAELGTWFGDRRQYDCASEAYRSALKLEPGSSRFYYLLGLSLYSSGNLEEAVSALQQSIDVAPEILKPHLILAAALERLQRKTDAKVQWQTALKIDPRSTVALDGFSKTLIDERNYSNAIALLRDAPSDENLTIDLAEAYVQVKMFDQASKLLKDALVKNPRSARIANTLTAVYLKQLHNQDAERLARKTAELHPSDLESQRLYLHALVLTGNSAVARPLAHKLLAQAPHDFDFLYLSGVMEQDAGELEVAREHLQQAVDLDPNVSGARYNLGVVLAHLKDAAGAKAQLQKALELGASEAEIHFQLAQVLRTLGENEQAAEQLKLYQAGLQERNRRSLAASKTAQGDKEIATGSAEKAAVFYREALEATPDDGKLNFKLAVALDRAGDITTERATLEKAVQVDPDLAVAYNQLGFLAFKSGDSQAAEKYFRQAVRAAPGFTEAWVNLAASLGLESRFSDAQQAVNSALQLEPMNAQALQLRETLARAQAQP